MVGSVVPSYYDEGWATGGRVSGANTRIFHGGTMLTDAELARTRRVQDAYMAQQRHDWDLSAKDNHSKSERCHFAVVGEGSHTAQEAYRTRYDLIDWSQ